MQQMRAQLSCTYGKYCNTGRLCNGRPGQNVLHAGNVLMSAHMKRETIMMIRTASLKQGYRNPTGFRRWVKVAKNQKLLYTHGMGTWKSKNRHKYLLQYHIIFVCKYRKKLLVSRQISDDIKQFSYEICQRHRVIIRYMKTDKGHIHYMIEIEPTMSISKIVNLMKSYTTYHIWKRYLQYL